MTKKKPRLTAKDKQALKNIAAGMSKRRKRTALDAALDKIQNGARVTKAEGGKEIIHSVPARPDPVGEIKITYTDQHRLYAPLTKLASCTAILAILWFLLGGTMPWERLS